MYRCSEYLKIISNLGKNDFSFIIIDEITGTNVHEGVAAGYAICKISNSLNNLSFKYSLYYYYIGKII